MIKVITYGTFDLLHYGHIRLLERAKALGDYLIVGVTADDFDKKRGKINVQQPLMERIEAVRATGIADEIIVEEFDGQKIDDIIRYNVDIFTVGSDWKGVFDYLSGYCRVVYLDRTEGISSTDLRSAENLIRLCLAGDASMLRKVYREAELVNGLAITGILADQPFMEKGVRDKQLIRKSFDELLEDADAIFLATHPTMHYEQIKMALQKKKHVLCESPVVLKLEEYQELQDLARQNGCLLVDSIKTAYATAYYRLLLLLKGGVIGDVVSVDSTCTSMRQVDFSNPEALRTTWNSICAWGPTAMLPIFQILGTDYEDIQFFSLYGDMESRYDVFTRINFTYSKAVASMKVGKGIKSEGELIISGTRGYIYVPAPWWKTEYFEIRYEDASENKRYFYKLDGEGIRYELVHFVKNAEKKLSYFYIDDFVTRGIIKVIQKFYQEN